MKNLSYALAIVFVISGPTYAQTGAAGATGTWRVESSGGRDVPWEVALRVNGTQLTGMVSSCTSRPVDIYESTITGNTITFKCKSGGNLERTITFVGKMDADEIVFTWKMQIPDGGISGNLVDQIRFGPSSPPQFIAKRVSNGALAELADQVRAVEFAAAVNILQKDVKVESRLLLPSSGRVGSVIVSTYWGLGVKFYEDPQVRRLLETTQSGLLLARFSNIGPSALHDANQFVGDKVADGLVLLLQRLADESGHRELADAPLLFWGFSAAGNVGPEFAALHPQRTIAFVLYQSAAGGLVNADMNVLNKIPMLVCSDNTPNTVGTVFDIGALLRRGRSVGAPWTFAPQPNAPHGDDAYFERAKDAMIPWITAVIRQRTSPDGVALRVVTDASALLGNTQTGQATPYSKYAGSKAEASWLPDEATARGWQTVLGVGAAK